MNEIIYNFWNDLPSIDKLNNRNKTYVETIINMGAEMFEIDGLTHAQTTHLLRTIFLRGSAYVKKTDESYIIAGGHFYGVPEPDEIYPNSYIATYYGSSWDIKDLKENDGTVCYCLPSCTPLTMIYDFASTFAQIDTSINNNIIFSRIAPIISAKSDRVRESYKKALHNMINGELENVINDSLTPSIDNTSGLPITDISNGAYSEKIQYLTMLHESVISRLAKLFGISYTFINKQANITNDELHYSDDYCTIYPMMFKKNLNECLEKLNLKVEFSKAWKWIDNLSEMRNDEYKSDGDNIEETENNNTESDNESEKNV